MVGNRARMCAATNGRSNRETEWREAAAKKANKSVNTERSNDFNRTRSVQSDQPRRMLEFCAQSVYVYLDQRQTVN